MKIMSHFSPVPWSLTLCASYSKCLELSVFIELNIECGITACRQPLSVSYLSNFITSSFDFHKILNSKNSKLKSSTFKGYKCVHLIFFQFRLHYFSNIAAFFYIVYFYQQYLLYQFGIILCILTL